MLGVFLVTVNPHNSSSQLILYLLANSDNTFIPASYAVILFSLIKSSIFASIKLVAKGLAGSPPLTRERPNVLFQQFFDFGITPAYAGKTSILVRRVFLYKDHPRLRGKDAL